MKFVAKQIHFLSDFFGLLSSKIFLPWQSVVTTCPLYPETYSCKLSFLCPPRQQSAPESLLTGYTIFGVKTHTPTTTHFISREISNHQVASKKLRNCLGANSISNGINRFNKTSKCASGEFCIKKPRFISSRLSSRSLIIRKGVLSPNSHFS